MSDNYAGNPANYPTNIRNPSGSDNRNATIEARALQDLADRTAYLAQRLGGPASSDGIWYPIPISAYIPEDITAGIEWELVMTAGDSGHPLPGIRTASTSSTSVQNSFVLPLSPFLPPSGILRDFEVQLYGVGHGSTMPAYMPSAQLYNYDPNTVVFTDYVGPGDPIECVDITMGVGDYETGHAMGIAFLSGGSYPIIDLAARRGLYLRVLSEYGTGAQKLTTFYNVRCKVASVGW